MGEEEGWMGWGGKAKLSELRERGRKEGTGVEVYEAAGFISVVDEIF